MPSKSVVDALPDRVFVARRSGGDERAVVAVIAPSYGLERMSYMMSSTHHRYVWMRRLPLQKLERRGNFLDQVPVIAGLGADLVHTFNQIPANKRFVTSVEMELPRFFGKATHWQRRVGLNLLASDRCRGIWPLSQAAQDFITGRFSRHGFPALADKTEIFRGAVLPAGYCDKTDFDPAKPIRLLFVGGDGLRKGLGPTLAALERLRGGGVNVEITVVGMPTATTYIVPGMELPVRPVHGLLQAPWVRHHSALNNAEVRRLMIDHDILAFPTMDESLGWVAIEAAASGMPTIATNVFALPELVLDGATGWTIDIALDEDRRWTHIGRTDAKDAWMATQSAITDRMVAIIAGVAADRGLIGKLGNAAREHIDALYGIDRASVRLDQLYASAMRIGKPRLAAP